MLMSVPCVGHEGVTCNRRRRRRRRRRKNMIFGEKKSSRDNWEK
jgi:hypothetical protein